MIFLNNNKTDVEKLNSENIFDSISVYENKIVIKLEKNKGLWGFGERFDSLNQVGLKRKNQVFEKFTNQGENTYIPIPFFLSNDFGLFVNTNEIIEINSEIINDINSIEIGVDILKFDVHIFKGTPKEQLNSFLSMNGKIVLPPKWCFGPWMSANRWNSQDIVLDMANTSKNLGFYHSALVIEAWSDEATFYKFNDKDLWPDPKKLVHELKDLGLNLVLWQVPVIKKLEEGHINETHQKDWDYAIEHNLVVRNKDDSIYKIPAGRWFENSMVPDFSNPETVKWWFDKRKYLLDMGVKGFKTDGGEFIYSEDVKFFDGTTGKEMINKYPYSYTKAYYDNLDDDCVLFSRAGYTNSWQTPVHWAGDQFSTWSELKHQLIAGLNASVSGIFYWGFDIAGFAGAMPSKELYLRAFMLGTFSPIMQWHSEPIGGQFAKIMKSKDDLNDRSPWNIANLYDDESIIQITRDYCSLRKDIQPYLYEEAKYSKENKIPLMRPLFFDYSFDDIACKIDDQYFLGRSLMVAPILSEGIQKRKIYLPKGTWYDCQNKVKIEGSLYIEREYSLSQIGLFINLDSDYHLLKSILI